MRVLVLVAAVCTAAFPAIGQTPVTNDLTPTLEPQQYRICNDRSERPAWVENVPPREAYKALTLMALYELRSWEDIAANRDCSCETRFPDWTAADAEYTARFAGLPQTEHTQAQRVLRRQASDLRHAVQAVCEAQGNW